MCLKPCTRCEPAHWRSALLVRLAVQPAQAPSFRTPPLHARPHACASAAHVAAPLHTRPPTITTVITTIAAARSPGKSGAVFLLSNDDQYFVKTIKRGEADLLVRMLPQYYRHMSSHPHTLLTKFYGLHSIKLKASGRKVRVHTYCM